MSSVVERLCRDELIKPPKFLQTNIAYETIMGSEAYGTSLQEKSDKDIYGFAIPPRDYIFPPSVIPGFGFQGHKFNQWQQHHIKDTSKACIYDCVILNIVDVFELARKGNPNIIDMLFVPSTCVLKTTSVGNLVRENRRLFLSKMCYPRYKGYAYSQLKKVDNKGKSKEMMDIIEFEDTHDLPRSTPYDMIDEEYKKRGSTHLASLDDEDLCQYKHLYTLGKSASGRFERNKIDSFDLKFSYHIVRLLGFAEQILATHDLDIQQDRERLKAIRRGEWTQEDIHNFFNEKEKQLEELYRSSTLQEECSEAKLHQLLMDCLETHYGSLRNIVVRKDEALMALKDIAKIVERFT